VQEPNNDVTHQGKRERAREKKRFLTYHFFFSLIEDMGGVASVEKLLGPNPCDRSVCEEVIPLLPGLLRTATPSSLDQAITTLKANQSSNNLSVFASVLIDNNNNNNNNNESINNNNNNSINNNSINNNSINNNSINNNSIDKNKMNKYQKMSGGKEAMAVLRWVCTRMLYDGAQPALEVAGRGIAGLAMGGGVEAHNLAIACFSSELWGAGVAGDEGWWRGHPLARAVMERAAEGGVAAGFCLRVLAGFIADAVPSDSPLALDGAVAGSDPTAAASSAEEPGSPHHDQPPQPTPAAAAAASALSTTTASHTHTSSTTSAVSALLYLPFQAFAYVLRGLTGSGGTAIAVANARATAAKRGVTALLVVAMQPALPPAAANPFKLALSQLRDNVDLSFVELYDALARNLVSEDAVLLTYLLLHANPMFLDYCLARTDMDTLMVPLLRMLYGLGSGGHPQQVYMLLTIFLILTQDSLFNSAMHTVMVQAPLPWLKERHVRPGSISVGSLTIVVLIRAALAAVATSRDSYLLTNCLAALANMSPHLRDLHPLAAERMVLLCDSLGKRLVRLGRALAATAAAPPEGAVVLTLEPAKREALEAEHAACTDYVRLALEIVNASITYALPRCKHLAYSLLYHRELFKNLGAADPQFADLVDNIELVAAHLKSAVAAATPEGGAALSAEETMAIVERSLRNAQGISARLKHFPEMSFQYEEQDCPHDFFVPYVWGIALRATAKEFGWKTERVILPVSGLAAAAAADEAEKGKK
jgi:hypothetical protein